jgi:hypothetical protein
MDVAVAAAGLGDVDGDQARRAGDLLPVHASWSAKVISVPSLERAPVSDHTHRTSSSTSWAWFVRIGMSSAPVFVPSQRLASITLSSASSPVAGSVGALSVILKRATGCSDEDRPRPATAAG